MAVPKPDQTIVEVWQGLKLSDDLAGSKLGTRAPAGGLLLGQLTTSRAETSYLL